MLPESKGYLEDAGWPDQAAGLVMMACFIGGFIGIQVVSRLLHQFIPSHVVDCDHSHNDSATQDEPSCHHSRRQSRTSRARRRLSRHRSLTRHVKSVDTHKNGHPHAHAHGHGHTHAHSHAHDHEHNETHHQAAESTPLLGAEHNSNGSAQALKRQESAHGDEMVQHSTNPMVTKNRTHTGNANNNPSERRPSMFQVQKRVMSFVKDTKCGCDELGSCYGYTDPCGQECFKHLSNRTVRPSRSQAVLRTTTGPFYTSSSSVFHDDPENHSEDDTTEQPVSPRFRTSRVYSREPLGPMDEDIEAEEHHDESCSSFNEDEVEGQHHHHVPTNAFLSIGLQTSIAIALHKFPEGFITYATNHANPSLGFNVFMALFVHNITEGFAMALPLYMALGSRWRAMAWSALLGGLSQPFGAAVAVIWFKVADRTHMNPSAVVYACLFAVTSGIMVSVALQLFVEGLSMNHDRNLCMFFGFIGMAVLGLSNALVADH